MKNWKYIIIRWITVILLFATQLIPANTQSTIYLHDFGTTTITTHPYTVAPGTFDANLNSSSWSNSTGSWTSFSGSNGQAIALSNSGGTPIITLTFNIASGYKVSINQFNFWRQRSATGAQNWAMTINSISVGSGTIPTSGAPIGITNVANPVTNQTGSITVTLSLSGASGSGTFRLDDFQLVGLVEPVTTCTPPSTQATSFSATNIQATQMQANWVRGTSPGDNVLVVARQGSAVTTDPTNGTSYTANAAFGTSGTELGEGYVVYNGPGTNVTVTNLTPSTTYHFAIYEYNTTGACYNLTQLTGNATTLGPEIQLEHPIATNVACGFSLDFGNVNVGSSTSLTVRVRNTGVANLNLTTLPLTITGTNANNYSVTTQPTSPIAPGDFSDIVIQFTPSSTGTRTASISIANNDIDENPCSISLTGVGTLTNDDCGTATSLTVYGTTSCGGATNGTTVGANSSGVPAITCNTFTGNADDDVWYSFVATSTSHDITVVGASPLDAVVDVRSGTCNGTNFACADATTSGGTEVVNATGLTIGETYLVRVYGYGSGSGTGTFTICVTTPAVPSYFRTKQSGEWTDANTWEVSTDNMTWSNAVNSPTVTDLDISVMHDVTISNGTVTTDQLVIESGATLDITGGTLSISDGTGDDLSVFGVLKNAGVISGVGTKFVKSGGKYQHNFTSLTPIPTLTWDLGSSCEVIGYNTTSGTQTGVNQSFHHFIWNCPSQSGNTNFTGAMTSLSGNLEVNNTGSGSLRLTGGTQTTLSISGNLIVTGGTLDLSSGTSNTIIELTGNFEISGGTLTESSTGSGTIEFNGIDQSFIKSAGTISNTINFIVNSGSSVDFSTYILDGSNGTFTLTSGATLKTANATGITGTIAVTGTKTFSSAANYEFKGNSTGTFTTTPTANTVNNLTLRRTGGDVSLDQDISVGGTLTLAVGRLNLNGKNLTLNKDFNVNSIPAWGSLSAKYIIASSGTVTISNPANYHLPLGISTEYLPCRLSGTGTFAVNISPTTTGLSNPSQALATQWNITGSGILDMDFQWTSNVFGTDAYLYKHNGSSWSNVGGPVATSGGGQYPYTVEFNGIVCCSGFTVGGEGLLPVELVYFKANQLLTSTLLTWQTASELNNSHFSIERSTDGANYREIGIVRGNGTSYVLNDYRFEDEQPASGINYYRLRQVDFDGNFEYSRVVSVNFGGREGEVQLYPTLASDEVVLRFSNPTTADGTISIFTQNGRLVSTLDFEEETTEVRIDVSVLPSGNYYARVRSGRLLETLRFAKQ